MGRKKLGGGGGGGGGGKRGSKGGPHGVSSSLVVVNPALMQTALKPNAQNTPGKKRKAPSSHSKPTNAKKPHTSTATGATITKRPQKNSVVTAVVQSAHSSGAGPKAPVALVVSRDEQLLVAAYWVVLSRAAKRSCVLVLPNSHERLTPQLVAGALRHVGFQALALHQKMTPGQRKESVERLASSPQLLLVTTAHLAGAAVCAHADVLLVGVAPQEAFAKFAAVFQVATSGASSYRPELTSALLQQLAARLRLATQIAELTQRLALANAKDVDSKWASKLARGAELASDDDDDDREEDGGKKKNKKRAPSPDEQRLQALTEKLALLVARRLETPSASAQSASSSGADGGRESADTQNGKEKLEALGLVTLSAAVGAALADERFSAQTRWMDAASGRQHGGDWDGDIRHGASKDASSLALRAAFCAVLKGDRKRTTMPLQRGEGGSSTPLLLLREWKPNRAPVDVDKWGGEFGKACGHNEVVMQSLRPFFPQEVLNSRVCSRLFPAPGNQGFDGCLEHLRLQCRAQQRAMTLWDADCFVYIAATGQVTWTKKNQLLQGLSLAALQCLMVNLRSWTLASRGEVPPKRLVRALQLCCALGGGEQPASRLEPALLKRIVSFAVGGSARLWKQITRVPPLQDEVVYS
ncbi:hypothetical protein PybrP1_003029 [[Pythium] brassicae (nom. inval.)]|nr:hypothetical protein PybrP1_003029 [[Pythium] brassicae (nom. inval.)]